MTYLMSPEGEFIDFYTQILSAPEMAERLLVTIDKREKEAGRSGAAGAGVLTSLQSLLGGILPPTSSGKSGGKPVQ